MKLKRTFGTALLIALVALTIVAIERTNSPASASESPLNSTSTAR